MAKKPPANGKLAEPVDISASPTKQFFVRMLTRDIDLRDAILDLLDNCVDGIVRSLPPQKSGGTTPYSGFRATITANPEQFAIEDNCGGIPETEARKYAFRLGKPADKEPEHLQTVGVYGIGMKRAIFKLGKKAVVTSENNGFRFRVEIGEKWLLDDRDWDLKLIPERATGKPGTRIEVTNLYDEIKRDFASGQSTFLSDLNESIRQLYAVIMGKGFEVTLNTQPLVPIPFKILMTLGKRGAEDSINPYIFKGTFGEIKAMVVVGFYRKPLSDEELEEENDSPKADLSQAGWSIICNDRLVVRSDKSALTGWGTVNVPRFHNQFSSIAGIVTLQSTDPASLPLNTTKRGIETSSDVYFRLLDYMREGVKKFTDFTNHWKSRLDEGKANFEHTVAKTITEIPDVISQDRFVSVTARRLASADASAQVFNPTLPKPSKEDGDTRKIVFSRPLKDIRLVAEELLDDRDAAPSQVGEACFDTQLAKLKSGRRRQ